MHNFQELGIKSIEDLKQKKVLVLGFGIEGQSISNYLIKQGVEFSVYDQKDKNELDEAEELEEKGVKFSSNPEDIKFFDVIIRSPGFRPTDPILAGSTDKIITSVTKLFFDLCPTKNIIGVTGTKGKGTTSTLVYEMLKKQGEDVYLGGNIGSSPFEFLDYLDSSSWVVLEMSSFQLIDIHKSPHIAVQLMTTSEHLDYHEDTTEYVDAKRNIFRFQGKNDFAITNQDYPASNESDIEGEGKTYKISRENEIIDDGCFVKEDKIVLKVNGEEKEIIETDKVVLPGKHNLENACAAVMAAVLAEVEIDTIKEVLKEFQGLEHRIEFVATVKGVSYYDDSFSTTPETAIAAVESFSQPKVLILGGSSKNSDFSELGDVISTSDSVKAVIGIGEEWPRIREKISNEEIELVESCSSMEEAVKEASKIANVGDVVLLSPACASFGMFENYKDRGNQFKEAVFGLTN